MTPTRYLLDTHTWLWAISSPKRLSPKVRRILQDTTNEFYLSVVSVWEIAIKMSRKKLELAITEDLDAFVTRTNVGAGVKSLQVSVSEACAVLGMPFHHSDPFDRLLLAQAASNGLIMLSRDKKLREYKVKIVW
jgi:PIN domain nuclease of toxin-antitoxin system